MKVWLSSLVALAAVGLTAALAEPPAGSLPLKKDCTDQACPGLAIKDDQACTLPNDKPSPFRGFADACIRKDPDRARLWMTYSWPCVKVESSREGAPAATRPARPYPGVETHLALSDDGGKTWSLHSVLWGLTPGASADGKAGHTSHEAVNFAAGKTATSTAWYAARMDYFCTDAGGFKERDPRSFRITVAQALSVPELAKAPSACLGSVGTDPKWGVDFDLSTLAPELRRYGIWAEPALHFADGELFLVLGGWAFVDRKPDLAASTLLVFAARPEGDVKKWKWRYVGKLAGHDEAKELGGDRLTQTELALGKDGKLLALVTPDTWSEEVKDFVHQGCRVLEVESLDPPKFVHEAGGKLKVRAVLTASDAGAHGTAAAAYDRDSATGIIFGKRMKDGAGFSQATSSHPELSFTLHATDVHP